MIREESQCVCCELPCIFDACPYYSGSYDEAELCGDCGMKEETEG